MSVHQNKKPVAKEAALVIGKKLRSALSKQQLTFNKLNQKIKSLRNQIKNATAYNDECLTYFTVHIFPLEQQTIGLKTEVAKLLYLVYTNEKDISKKDKKDVKNVILHLVDDVFAATDRPDDALKTIFNTLSGDNYDEIIKDEIEEALEDMKVAFTAMGLNIDMSDINKDDDAETIMRKMHIQMQQARHRAPKEPPLKKKTKKQLAAETKEKELATVREQSIKNIYRQLVKALHPDLERNEDLRIEKEALMKELTIAYKSNDLHTLLRLELHWLQRESDHLETLTDDKLRIYNELLNEQVNELHMELAMTVQNPRYDALERFFNIGGTSMKLLKAEPGYLKQTINSLQSTISNLKNGNIKSEIKTIIYSYELSKMEDDSFDEWRFDDDGDF